MVILLICILFILILPYIYFKKPNIKHPPTGDVILVLGYPAAKDGFCSDILEARMKTAIDLYQQNICTKMILSGSHTKNQYIEAQVMRDYAINNGVKKEDILLETQAKNTYQNIKYSVPILKEYLYKNVIIVTSPWHLRKANHFASQFNISYCMVKSSYPKNYTVIHIIFAYIYSYLNMYHNFLYALFKK